jgi:transcriptional regulator with XRE-family HTH domain
VPTVGDFIAAGIRTHRLRMGLSIRQLAEECAKRGAPQLTAASLSNIERGQDENAKRKRRDVSVEELLVLAYILDAIPADLLFCSAGSEVEVVPGVVTHPYVAWKWLLGMVPHSEIWGPLIKTEGEVPRWNSYFGWDYIDVTYDLLVHARERLMDAKAAGEDVNAQPDPELISVQAQYDRALIRMGIAMGETNFAARDVPPIPKWMHDDLRAAEAAGEIRMRDDSGRHPRVDSDGWVPVRLPSSIDVQEGRGSQ